MRFSGRLKTWNDERGFRFIEADQGGQELFDWQWHLQGKLLGH
jgi:cold shock CspA family protein